ncbi:MAG: UDP-N-acetylglucosamine 1-carboxyvinyltransferase [Patescibacteria group bacterium]
MDTFVIEGGKPLIGEVTVAGAKNVAVKALVASLLTDEPLKLLNMPHIHDVHLLLELLSKMGIQHTWSDHEVTLTHKGVASTTVPLDLGARIRTSAMLLGPLLSRFGDAKIPNPGGCRIGARPIDRHIDALRAMGAQITYNSQDGYFYGKADTLHGTHVTFPKNTHTGTETILLAAVLAEGETVIDNAAEEVEVDDLISLLTSMGANIKRPMPRQIVVTGVSSLHGCTYRIMPDRNEEVTFAIAAAITGGNITVHDSNLLHLTTFLEFFTKAGGLASVISPTETRYSLATGTVGNTDVVTMPHPGFMTDWQGPWAVFMTQAKGVSTIHETVFESRFSYVSELHKMGAKIEYFTPKVKNPSAYYNFNWADKSVESQQAIRITGKTELHNAVLSMNDLRAGATLVLAALTAKGKSYVHGVEQMDRGYEHIVERLQKLGASISRVKEEE